MIENGPKQQYADVMYIPFQNDNHINVQLDNTSKRVVSLQPNYLLHYVVYPVA